MAASTITAAHLELINSLAQDEIPIKLRCAMCSKLAVNAFRLPCCEQAICESCQSILPSTCPVCEHAPVAAEDCKPNKSLRTTIKVFLRTEEKKREALRLKGEKATPPDTPVQPEATPAEAPAIEAAPISEKPTDASAEAKADEALPSEITAESGQAAPEEQDAQAQQDVPQPSIEVCLTSCGFVHDLTDIQEIAPGQESVTEAEAEKEGITNAENGDGESQKVENGQPINGQGMTQPGAGAGFGYDPTTAGSFPGMGFGGDLAQQQQQMMMMAMQNGMGGGFGNFPMMGMPGMGMDPMMMSTMFANGGFGGAGMNGMNMGMGMGGFDGGVGTGFSNAWNGQQSWNGQDNFSHPNGMAGDFGANNSGYLSHASGFNQGNYGRPNQFNDYNSYGSQGFRGRGRGRGGYGRGGFAHQNDAYSQQQYPQQIGQQNGSADPSIPKGPKADNTAGDVDEFGREIRQKSEAEDDKSAKPADDENAVHESGSVVADNLQPVDLPADATPMEAQEDAGNVNVAMPIQTLEEVDSYGQNTAYNMDAYGASRGGYGQGSRGGRGGHFSMQPPVVNPVTAPVNAPTGPKAMREGLPNTSVLNLRGRGYSAAGRSNSRTTGVSVPPEIEPDDRDRERSTSVSKDKPRDKSRSRSRDRKRSRSRSRERRHRRRHRSTSLSEDDKETERRRERRRERHRRRDEEGHDEERDGAVVEEANEVAPEVRSRSASPSEAKRSSHRSRRDRDEYRDRDRKRDSDREHKSSSHRHRSHRSHRDDRDRSRSRDRDHKHRHSRHHSEALEDKTSEVNNETLKTPIETQHSSRRPSTTSNTIEIKGASSRRKLEEIVIPTGPRQDRTRDREREKEGRSHHEHRSSRHESSRSLKERENGKSSTKSSAPVTPTIKDPYELEREARNRERLQKEAQLLAGLAGGKEGRKRSYDDGAQDDGSGRRGRKKGRRIGAVVDENEEARLARMEAEREGARWG